MVYNLTDLRKEYQEGKIYKFVFFWGHRPSSDGQVTKACFSQWWKSRFEVEGRVYCCAEQFMMAEKARMFGDEEMLSKIMESTDPKEMKAYGRAVRNFDKDLWESACFEVVKKGNSAKFSQNPRDRIWGIGMGESNPDAENPLKWRGTNLLGFALTQVRDQWVEAAQGEDSELAKYKRMCQARV